MDNYISWLVKVRNRLDKIEKEHSKTLHKKLASLSRNSYPKRMVFDQFHEQLCHFQFKSQFFYCNSLCPEFKLLNTWRKSVHLLRLAQMMSNVKSSNRWRKLMILVVAQGITQSLVHKSVIIRTIIQHLLS